MKYGNVFDIISNDITFFAYSYRPSPTHAPCLYQVIKSDEAASKMYYIINTLAVIRSEQQCVGMETGANIYSSLSRA